MADRTRPGLQRQLETQAAVIGAGLLWFAVLEWLIAQPHIGAWAAGIAAVVIILVGGIWLSIQGSRWLLMNHLFVVLVTSGLALTFVTDPTWRHGVAVVGAGMVMAAFRQALEPPEHHLRGRLAAFTMTIVMWFGWISIFSVNVFTNLTTWWFLLFGAAITTAVAIIVWAEADVPWSRFVPWLPVWAIFGAEVAAVTWWLPTSIFVSSIVATTLLMLVFQAMRHYWLETWTSDRGRRYVSVGLSIIVVVLLTARWM